MEFQKLNIGKSVVVNASHWGVAPLEKKKWTGTKPDKCDICAEKLTDFWVDGKTRQGPWGNMCLKCHVAHGVGLGNGRGQQYDAKTLLKVKGSVVLGILSDKEKEALHKKIGKDSTLSLTIFGRPLFAFGKHAGPHYTDLHVTKIWWDGKFLKEKDLPHNLKFPSDDDVSRKQTFHVWEEFVRKAISAGKLKFNRKDWGVYEEKEDDDYNISEVSDSVHDNLLKLFPLASLQVGQCIVIGTVSDKNKMKAIFLAGGPGSGKSFVTQEMFGANTAGLSPMGTFISASDKYFEHELNKANLPLEIADAEEDPELHKKQYALRDKATKITLRQEEVAANEMKPIVVDGTGHSFEKVKARAEHFKKLGYDVGLVFVETSVDVAQKRNLQRKRKLKPKLVDELWSSAQANKNSFKEYFGKNFAQVDNNKDLEGEEKREFSTKLFRIGKKFVEAPLENPLGKKRIERLKATGGSNLNDLPEMAGKFKHIKPSEKAKKLAEKEGPALKLAPSEKEPHENWFDKLNEEEQKDYVENHPGTKYKVAAKVKNH